MKIFTSSGGCGDALVASIKISNKYPEAHWLHFEKHQCHAKAIEEIMIMSGLTWGYKICDKPYNEAIEVAKKQLLFPAIDQYGPDGGYVSSACRTLENPFIAKPTPMGREITKIPEGSICVQAMAGRPHDNTRRIVTDETIKQIQAEFNTRSVVLVGPERVDAPDGVFNLTGETDSIIDVFGIIDQCAGFIGHDGVCAYYALMRRIPTYISYHMAMLAEHYWHDDWSKTGFRVISGNVLSLNNNMFYMFVIELSK